MVFSHFLYNILFYFYSFTLILNLILFFFKIFMLIIDSLNLALCLHRAINSYLFFNNFSNSG